MEHTISRYIFIGIILSVLACEKNNKRLFIPLENTAINFENTLDYTEALNPYTYRNFYNGGGVAIGDINNDGLEDIYFTAGIKANQLYLNKGDWNFEDISASAGTALAETWSTGATFVDINNDGWLDLYVCTSGPPESNKAGNALFINQKDGTFIESAESYQLNIKGLSTQAAFFDYDRDGDLDCYLLTNSYESVGVGQEIVVGRREIPAADGIGNKLLENKNGKFEDVTLNAGIYSSDIGFGLGITLGDFNQDDWVDVFISNDFFERDYLYINQHDGTFQDEAEQYFTSLSMGSMGADAADLNNDGLSDLMVTEMLPSTLARQKTKALFESWDKYQFAVSRGYHHQYPRNVLQRNTGNGHFLEIGRYAGVAASDWSWAALLFDMDNDGLKDLFIANGIYKDLLDRDYLNYYANDENVRSLIKSEENPVMKLVDAMPSIPINNIFMKNGGDFTFVEEEGWGADQASFSSGSAYADLDNDGDLDLVINNVNMPASILQNQTDQTEAHYLKISLADTASNNGFGVGAKLTLWFNDQMSTQEFYPSRGFQSSIAHNLTFGLGQANKVDSLQVFWPDGSTQKLFDLAVNTSVKITKAENTSSPFKVYEDLATLQKSPGVFNYLQEENDYVDFDRERLLPYMTSNEGPAVAMGDITGNGQEEVIIGGSKNHSLRIFTKTEQETYEEIHGLIAHSEAGEDAAIELFDFDRDGDLDMYIGQGGKAFSSSSPALMDKFYENINGKYELRNDVMPSAKFFSTSTVISADVNGDGYPDLYVAERYKPEIYGLGGRSYLLINDEGKGFSDETIAWSAELAQTGMVTDAVFADFNNDGNVDLVVAGDWQAIKVYLNEGDRFSAQELANSAGLWQNLNIADFDDDGYLDFFAGNIGQNNFFEEGLRMYINDFDQNGTTEQILAKEVEGQYYPIADRDELLMQLPYLKKKNLTYESYAQNSLNDLFSDDQLKASEAFELEELSTAVFMNKNGRFVKQKLPAEAQYTTIFTSLITDLNKDGYLDILLGGNQFNVKPQFGRQDASKGLILFGSEEGFNSDNIEFMSIDGQLRSLKLLNSKNDNLILVIKNEEEAEVYRK